MDLIQYNKAAKLLVAWYYIGVSREENRNDALERVREWENARRFIIGDMLEIARRSGTESSSSTLSSRYRRKVNTIRYGTMSCNWISAASLASLTFISRSRATACSREDGAIPSDTQNDSYTNESDIVSARLHAWHLRIRQYRERQSDRQSVWYLGCAEISFQASIVPFSPDRLPSHSRSIVSVSRKEILLPLPPAPAVTLTRRLKLNSHFPDFSFARNTNSSRGNSGLHFPRLRVRSFCLAGERIRIDESLESLKTMANCQIGIGAARRGEGGRGGVFARWVKIERQIGDRCTPKFRMDRPVYWILGYTAANSYCICARGKMFAFDATWLRVPVENLPVVIFGLLRGLIFLVASIFSVIFDIVIRYSDSKRNKNKNCCPTFPIDVKNQLNLEGNLLNCRTKGYRVKFDIY